MLKDVVDMTNVMSSPPLSTADVGELDVDRCLESHAIETAVFDAIVDWHIDKNFESCSSDSLRVFMVVDTLKVVPWIWESQFKVRLCF